MAIELTSVSNLRSLGNMPVKKLPTGAAQTASAADFSSVLSEMARQAASTIRASEETAMKGVQGQAPVQEVVQSVMRAQTSLQTALALRDKAISAYQDLTRMPI